MASVFSGQGAIVTGGASGMGRATAMGFVQAGASVAVFDRDEAGLAAMTQDHSNGVGRLLPIAIDLANTAAIPDAISKSISQLGRIDILVNCAAITGKSPTLLGVDEDEWDLIMTINLKAAMLMIKYVGKHMIENGRGGHIVNVSSSSAFRAKGSRIAYACSKAALVQLTRNVAAELGPYDINVNAVAPGLTVTPMSQAIHGGSDNINRAVSSPGSLENLLHRVSMPEDTAAVILFLCEPRSRQITGQTIHTSAGQVV